MSDVKIIDQHGKGLAATRDFKSGEHVAIYATKALPISNLTIENYRYMYNNGKETSFFGDHKEFGGIGRYANDPMTPELYAQLFKCTTFKSVVRWCQANLEASLRDPGNVEARKVGESLILVAIKDIKAGDAIMYSYTFLYWLDEVILFSNASPRTKLACCLVLLDMGSTPVIISDPIFPFINTAGAPAFGAPRIPNFNPNEHKIAEENMCRLQAFLGYAERGAKHWLREISLVHEFDKNCVHCKKPNPQGRCPRCQLYHYCNKDCQSKNWPSHKKICPLL